MKRIILRSALALSLLGLGWALWSAWDGLRRVERIRAMPRWETLSGPTFPLEVGATGDWGPTWTPVVDPLGPALAYLDVVGRRIDVEPDVRIRTDPVAAVTPWHEGRRPDGGEWRISTRFDFRYAVTLDPAEMRRITWRVESVPEDLVGAEARLVLDGELGTDRLHEADHNELANWVGGSVCTVFMLLLALAFALALRRHPHDMAVGSPDDHAG